MYADKTQCYISVPQEVSRKRRQKTYVSVIYKSLYFCIFLARVSAETVGTTYVDLVTENRFPFVKFLRLCKEKLYMSCHYKYLFSFIHEFHSGVFLRRGDK